MSSDISSGYPETPSPTASGPADRRMEACCHRSYWKVPFRILKPLPKRHKIWATSRDSQDAACPYRGSPRPSWIHCRCSTHTHSQVSTGGGLRACRGITSVWGDWVSTKMKSSKSPRESGMNWTMYWQVIPGATIPPFPGNIPVDQ